MNTTVLAGCGPSPASSQPLKSDRRCLSGAGGVEMNWPGEGTCAERTHRGRPKRHHCEDTPQGRPTPSNGLEPPRQELHHGRREMKIAIVIGVTVLTPHHLWGEQRLQLRHHGDGQPRPARTTAPKRTSWTARTTTRHLVRCMRDRAGQQREVEGNFNWSACLVVYCCFCKLTVLWSVSGDR